MAWLDNIVHMNHCHIASKLAGWAQQLSHLRGQVRCSQRSEQLYVSKGSWVFAKLTRESEYHVYLTHSQTCSRLIRLVWHQNKMKLTIQSPQVWSVRSKRYQCHIKSSWSTRLLSQRKFLWCYLNAPARWSLTNPRIRQRHDNYLMINVKTVLNAWYKCAVQEIWANESLESCEKISCAMCMHNIVNRLVWMCRNLGKYMGHSKMSSGCCTSNSSLCFFWAHVWIQIQIWVWFHLSCRLLR